MVRCANTRPAMSYVWTWRHLGAGASNCVHEKDAEAVGRRAFRLGGEYISWSADSLSAGVNNDFETRTNDRGKFGLSILCPI